MCLDMLDLRTHEILVIRTLDLSMTRIFSILSCNMLVKHEGNRTYLLSAFITILIVMKDML